MSVSMVILWAVALLTYPVLESAGKGGPVWTYLLTLDLALGCIAFGLIVARAT